MSETSANNIEFGASMSYLLFYRFGCCIPEWLSNCFCIAWALGDEAYIQWTAAAAKSLQLCPTLCNPIDGSPPGSPVPGVLGARTLEWVAISFLNAWKWKVKVKLLSRVALSDPTDCGLPDSSHRIFQARVLEWGAIAFSYSVYTWLQIPWKNMECCVWVLVFKN